MKLKSWEYMIFGLQLTTIFGPDLDMVVMCLLVLYQFLDPVFFRAVSYAIECCYFFECAGSDGYLDYIESCLQVQIIQKLRLLDPRKLSFNRKSMNLTKVWNLCSLSLTRLKMKLLNITNNGYACYAWTEKKYPVYAWTIQKSSSVCKCCSFFREYPRHTYLLIFSGGSDRQGTVWEEKTEAFGKP